MKQSTKIDLVGMSIKYISGFFIMFTVLATYFGDPYILLLIPISIAGFIFGGVIQVKARDLEDKDRSMEE